MELKEISKAFGCRASWLLATFISSVGMLGTSNAQVVMNSPYPPIIGGDQLYSVPAPSKAHDARYLSSPIQPASSSVFESTISDTQQTIGACQCPECQQSSPGDEQALEAAAARQAKIRSQLTGDWCGQRSCLEERGIGIRSSLTQFYQGVASGGAEQQFSYGGKFDLYFDLNTEKMGLWEGGEILVHLSDWQFGQNAITDAEFGSPVNFNLLFPEPESNFAVSTLLLTQGLNERGLLMLVGRYSLLDLWASFYPDYGFGLDGFMNASSIVPFNIALAGLPPISNVGGLVKAGDKGLEAGFLVFENNDNSNRIGLDFPNGVTMLGFGRKYTEFGGLFGSHTVAATWATGDFTSLDVNDWIQVPGGVPTPTSQSGQWAAVYIGEQRLYQDPCDKQRYTTLRGSFCWGDEVTNPYNLSSAITLEKFGVGRRDRDRMGLAYFHNGLGDDFQNLLNFVEPHGSSVQGGEFYYNAQINPWFNLSFDLQAVSPINTSNNTAIVPAIRGKINF